jgi:hypothetical protein
MCAPDTSGTPGHIEREYAIFVVAQFGSSPRPPSLGGPYPYTERKASEENKKKKKKKKRKRMKKGRGGGRGE